MNAKSEAVEEPVTKTPLKMLSELRDGCRVNANEREALERVIRLVNLLEFYAPAFDDEDLVAIRSSLDLVTVGGRATVVDHGRAIDVEWPVTRPSFEEPAPFRAKACKLKKVGVR